MFNQAEMAMDEFDEVFDALKPEVMETAANFVAMKWLRDALNDQILMRDNVFPLRLAKKIAMSVPVDISTSVMEDFPDRVKGHMEKLALAIGHIKVIMSREFDADTDALIKVITSQITYTAKF